MGLKPIDRVSFEAGELIREHPPELYDGNKQLVFEIARWAGFPFEGQVDYARWPAQELPEEVTLQSAFSVCPGYFAYAAPGDPAAVAWHVNFSDPHLFVAYGGQLLAQDELQVAEHPILGSVREALDARGMPVVTVDERGSPTPVTITGVQRRCVLDTLPNPAVGCPFGLYGNAFAKATEEQVEAATLPLSPPTMSNILAMAAPREIFCAYDTFGRNLNPFSRNLYSRNPFSRAIKYDWTKIFNALCTAFTGFAAARSESERLVPDVSRTVIHTGFWGCGAFGGNRRLMTILQAFAADLADVDVVFWASGEPGIQLAEDAYQWYQRQRQDTPSVGSFLECLVDERFLWGLSNGT